jgi:phospholipid-binding lipoprotein MlaA
MPTVNLTCSTPELPRPRSTPSLWMRPSSRTLVALSVAVAMASSLPGCAALPAGSTRDPRDHVERFNRAMYKFNTALDRAILRPVARGYVEIAPAAVRACVTRVLGNLEYTRTVGNDVLQGRFVDFGSDIARLAVNTIIGIGGLFDPATRLGLEKHDRDFGQTLGKWGLPTGTYLALPFIGPTDVRDGLGLLPDRFMTVAGHVGDPVIQVTLGTVGKVDGRAAMLPFDRAIETAYDPYALVRNVWFERREYKVRGDSVTSASDSAGPVGP